MRTVGPGRIVVAMLNTLPSHPALAAVSQRSVPRYTSYPTAPHFSAAVDAAVYGDWLERAGRSGLPVSLSLHIPFCRSLCHYCGGTTGASRPDGPARAYVSTLRQEIALVAARLGRVAVSHVHWGGGTPNLLARDDMQAIVGDLDRAFDLGSVREHAIELDPRSFLPGDGAFLAALGVTRASLGVQDLDARVQAAIGRLQPLEVVASAVDDLRQAGIGAIGMDLIYGLPFQTHQSIRRTAEQAAALAPSRLSLFGYAHVPWFQPNRTMIDDATLPDSDLRLALARTARSTLEANGYEEIGIDHFARPDDDLTRARDRRTLHRNVRGYTTDDAQILIGLGSSAIGRTPWGYVQNSPANGVWRRAVEAGRLPVERGKAFDGEDRLRAAVIEDLLCQFDVDLAAVAERFGAPVGTFDAAIEDLDPLIRLGFVAHRDDRIEILQSPAEIARVVASAFDAYLGKGGRHAAAV